MSLLTLMTLLTLALPAADPPPLAGAWVGELVAGAARARIVLRIEEGAAGLAGHVDSPDEGLESLPAEGLQIDGIRVSFELRLAGARFEGQVAPGGSRIEGRWIGRAGELPLTLVRSSDPPRVVPKTQVPQPPFPYQDREVTVTGAGGVTLAGTLTVPNGKGPFPGVVLLTVAGPNDRDQTHSSGHKPFWILADHLARRGIAVLRLDDRGIGGSRGAFLEATMDDLAADAVAAARFLAAQPGVDPRRVGLLGNSEGGYLAALGASRAPEVAFAVLLAAPGVPSLDLLRRRSEDEARRRGLSPEETAAVLGRLERLLEIVRQPRVEQVERDLRAFLGARPLPTQFAWMPADVEGQVRFFSSPWYRTEMAIDPAPVIRSLRVAVLALGGSKDHLNPSEQSLPAIQSALEEGGNPDYTVAKLPSLNHVFQTAETGGMEEWGRLPETFAPLALTTISDWTLARFGELVPSDRSHSIQPD